MAFKDYNSISCLLTCMLYLSLSNLVAVSLNQVGDAGLPLLATNLAKETSRASSLLDKTVEGPGLPLGVWATKCHFKVSFDIPITLAAPYTDVPCHTIVLAFSMASAVYFFFSLPIFIPYLNSHTFTVHFKLINQFDRYMCVNQYYDKYNHPTYYNTKSTQVSI